MKGDRDRYFYYDDGDSVFMKNVEESKNYKKNIKHETTLCNLTAEGKRKVIGDN